MKRLNSRGFSAVEGLLILVVIAIIGVVGYFVISASNKATTTSTTSATTQSKTPEASKPKTKQYKNDELALSFTYPEGWGNATASRHTQNHQSSVDAYDYTAVSFSNKKQISINFVVAGFDSQRDGCGGQSVELREYGRTYTHASLIGWGKGVIKNLIYNPVANEYYKAGDRIVETKISTSNTNIYNEVGQVLEYRVASTEPAKAHKMDPDAACDAALTQAQADEINAYDNIVNYAVNFSNAKVKGTNAEFDARQTDDTAVRKELLTVLGSIK
jgi:flagellin-like protein